jgi:deoxyadenosine/deoxycytidine kinase
MFIVEGNIGTGKSTFLKALRRSLSHVSVTLEAVDYWQNESNGQSILQNFYESPQRWAYSMETIALKTRIQEHIKNQESLLPNIVERSMYSGYHCFARNSFEQGFLNQLEWNIYQAWFDFLTSKQCLPPAGFIYLQADPQLSYNRTVRRKRGAEESISLDYLKQIHDKHEAFLIDKLHVHPSILHTPVLILDCNYDLRTDKKKLLNYIELVQQFIQDHTKKVIHSQNVQSTNLQI